MSEFRTSDAEWEQYTAYPIDKKVVFLTNRVTCDEDIFEEGQSAIELSFSRRINYFESRDEQVVAWLERLSDDIVDGAKEGERTPLVVVYYGAADVDRFRWENHGFTIENGAPLPGDMFKHPVNRQPLNDDPTSPLRVVTASIKTLDLLLRCGYEI